jgi:hypothetical protein
MTKTVRSRFNHEVGEQVEGCTILEKRVIIPPCPNERRLGVYDYVVEAPPAPVPEVKARPSRKSAPAEKPSRSAPEPGSFTRGTPDEVGGSAIRRLPPR